MGDTGEKTHHIGIQFAQLVCRELRPVRVEDGVLVVGWLRLSSTPHYFGPYFTVDGRLDLVRIQSIGCHAKP